METPNLKVVKNVEIFDSETRKPDEDDEKPFTMYKLRICFTDDTSCELWRRYSQFWELKEHLEAAFPNNKALKDFKFPPKVWFNKLADSVVKKRFETLGEYLNVCLTTETVKASDEILSFLELTGNPIKVGAEVPAIDFKDINGQVITYSDYAGDDKITVFTVASRYTYEPMQAWFEKAQDKVVAKYGKVTSKINYLGFSDLRGVPAMFEGKVIEVLKKVNTKTQEKMKKGFSTYSGGIPPFHFIPIWDRDAALLEKLGCPDSKWTYRVWVSYKGKILCSIQSSTPNLEDVYLQAFEQIAQSQQ